ncbi:polysaccharide biosynthesis/export family protein [Sphingobium sp. H39-3-25]|uniref:polysaccharide biosynthesis/export family protein n=1 Tax=Sphingobium arseniciresistens TaxID=3030834 RepID=UPI0023B8E70A|nr:polysaccharide biosynthesis/export family protein [Sphingobium arseniciresistens]
MSAAFRLFAHHGPAIGRAAIIAALVAGPCSFTASGQTMPTSVAATVAAPDTISKYDVNSGDELEVFVWGEERMQRAVRVQPDGTFAFPLAGTIKASGRSVTDIAAEIRERISVNYRSGPPDVTVSVREATGMRFYVIGKVRTPGSYTSGSAINILQALSLAGGPAEFADLKNAVVLRQTPSGQIVEPVQLARVLKGRRAMSAGDLDKPLPVLLSGDVLVVP